MHYFYVSIFTVMFEVTLKPRGLLLGSYWAVLLTDAHFLVVLLPSFGVIWLTPGGLARLTRLSWGCCSCSWSLSSHRTFLLLAIILSVVGFPCCILVCCSLICAEKQRIQSALIRKKDADVEKFREKKYKFKHLHKQDHLKWKTIDILGTCEAGSCHCW